jgi:DNA-binding ferritin-like protein
MNANELADALDKAAEYLRMIGDADFRQAATMLRQQQAKIKQHQEEKKALYNLVAEQDKKIIDLAFKLAYAERSNEIVTEANTRSRP